jgi:hypothetical protein
MNYMLSGRADAIRLDGGASAPTDQGHKHCNDSKRVKEATRIEREVAEVTNRPIAQEIRGCSVAHLVDRDRDKKRWNQKEGREKKK